MRETDTTRASNRIYYRRRDKNWRVLAPTATSVILRKRDLGAAPPSKPHSSSIVVRRGARSVVFPTAEEIKQVGKVVGRVEGGVREYSFVRRAFLYGISTQLPGSSFCADRTS